MVEVLENQQDSILKTFCDDIYNKYNLLKVFFMELVVNTEKQSATKARLIIADFECSPEEITQTLSIYPTKTWLRGETVTPTAKNVHKENGWMIASPCDPLNSTVDVQVDSLISIITPHIEAFAKLPTGVYIELSCIIRVADYGRPVIGFATNTVRVLAQIGANIDIDIYDLRGI